MLAPVLAVDRMLADAVGGGADDRRVAGGDADVRRAGTVGVEEHEVTGLDRRARDGGAGVPLVVARARERDAGLGHRPLRQPRAAPRRAGPAERVGRAELGLGRGDRGALAAVALLAEGGAGETERAQGGRAGD